MISLSLQCLQASDTVQVFMALQHCSACWPAAQAVSVLWTSITVSAPASSQVWSINCKNAPYKTWNLASSINLVNKTYSWIVWVSSKTAPYAKLREYVNKKNPHKRFYMKRALESSIKEIEDFFNKNILAYIIKKK